MVDGNKVKFCKRIGMFEQASCELVSFLLPDCIWGWTFYLTGEGFLYLTL